jgi:hypothetical protein
MTPDAILIADTAGDDRLNNLVIIVVSLTAIALA